MRAKGQAPQTAVWGLGDINGSKTRRGQSSRPPSAATKFLCDGESGKSDSVAIAVPYLFSKT